MNKQTNINIRTDVDVILEVPNEDTVKAINEASNIIKDSNSKGFNNIDELKKGLE